MALQLCKTIKHLLLSKANKKALLFWFLPLLLALGFQILGFGINRDLPRNFTENTATLFILLGITLLFNKFWQTFFQKLFYVLIIFYFLFESIYYYLFKANISSSSIFILLETNLAEAREFMDFYLNPFIIVMVISFLLILIFYFIKQCTFKFSNANKFNKALGLSMVLIPLSLMVYKGYERYNFYYLFVSSISEYAEEQNKMKLYNINSPTTNIPDFNVNSVNDTMTCILLISESTTRKRLGLYGYNRPNTPFLNSIKKDILIYDNVLSHHAYTIGSLKTALTLNSLNGEQDFSIIQMMNLAGFETYWISNQRPIGQYESLVTQIALSSDVYVTKNTAFDGSITPYDDVLIPEFEKVITSKAKKKFIVLHPLATHLLYADRHPKEFKKFSGDPPTKFKHKKAIKRSNDYDNAILYHDYILKSLFDKIKDIKHPVYFLYFSDHGEEVYESIDFSGHAEENPTKSMYEVPFFIWMNTSYKENFHFNYIPNNPYSLKHFFHTIADLNGFRFKGYDPTKSIFFQQDTINKRKLGSGSYYEELP